MTLADADTFFAGHYSLTKAADWDALSTAQKEAALRRATQMIDTVRVLDLMYGSGVLPIALREYAHYDIVTHRANIGQKLNFPRNIDVQEDAITLFIPQPIKDSTCEQALFLVNFDDSNLQTQLTGIAAETIEAGPVRVHQQFRAGAGVRGVTALAPIVIELMTPFIRPSYRVRRS